MPDTPPESTPSPSAEPEAQMDTGEPKEPASGELPAPASTPKTHGEAAPVADAEEARALPEEEDGFGRWSVRIGEVFDFGEQGSFTVKERLGRGGMGEVYRANYVTPAAPKFVQVFALKVLRPDARPHEQRTFIDEVHLLSLLRHDSIARYHTYFLDHGRQVLVMEYVEGRSLHSLIRLAWRKGRALSESTTLELLAQIAEALDYLHRAKDGEGRPLNIVHRDISPANIMVTNAGFAKLVDFGVARADLDGRTRTLTGAGLVKGKVPYLSPEQVQRKPLDSRSDLFSLCCVLVEMLTGDPPFGRMMDLATLRSIQQVTPKDVDRVTRRLSKKVRAICRRGLARDPAQRFADGHEMARAMLAHYDYQGPRAVLEEIAGLEALPDLTPEIVEKLAAGLRRVQRRRRVLERLGGLACAAVAAFFIWNAYHSMPPTPAAPPPAAVAPHEQPMSPPAEQGMPNVNNEMKLQPPAPPVAKTAPTPLPVPGARSCAKILAAAGMLAANACAHVTTGAKAGDCFREPVHFYQKQLIPDEFLVQLDETNPKGWCTGEWDPHHLGREEPCPAYEGPIVLYPLEQVHKYGQPRIDWYGPYAAPGERQSETRKAPLFIGRSYIFKAEGMVTEYDPRDRGKLLVEARVLWTRPSSKRMTALITDIQMLDGKTLPVCGVLFGSDGEEGVPILTQDHEAKPTSWGWDGARIRFFWPEQ